MHAQLERCLPRAVRLRTAFILLHQARGTVRRSLRLHYFSFLMTATIRRLEYWPFCHLDVRAMSFLRGSQAEFSLETSERWTSWWLCSGGGSSCMEHCQEGTHSGKDMQLFFSAGSKLANAYFPRRSICPQSTLSAFCSAPRPAFLPPFCKDSP